MGGWESKRVDFEGEERREEGERGCGFGRRLSLAGRERVCVGGEYVWEERRWWV